MQKFDVVALGELLVDFTENGMSGQGNTILEANPGGAPCNVLSMLQRLGKKTAFIGKVGNDNFGRMLRDVVSEQGINTDNVIFDDDIHTTLAFVHTKEDGDRDFSFYRNPGANICHLYKSANTLYKNDKTENYILIMQQGKLSPESFNKICNLASEYGTQQKNTSASISYYEEHFEPLIRYDALQKLA
jgi:sugar/nucleoside kinase (ribokinase family)